MYQLKLADDGERIRVITASQRDDDDGHWPKYVLWKYNLHWNRLKLHGCFSCGLLLQTALPAVLYRAGGCSGLHQDNRKPDAIYNGQSIESSIPTLSSIRTAYSRCGYILDTALDGIHWLNTDSWPPLIRFWIFFDENNGNARTHTHGTIFPIPKPLFTLATKLHLGLVLGPAGKRIQVCSCLGIGAQYQQRE